MRENLLSSPRKMSRFRVRRGHGRQNISSNRSVEDGIQAASKKRFTSNFELLGQDKVLFVDAKLQDLKPGAKLEGVVRRLDYEGKDGLIMYGVAYRPLFREALAQVARPKAMTVAPPQYA